MQARGYSIVKTSPELSSAVLESVYVGSEKSSMSLVQKELVTADIDVSNALCEVRCVCADGDAHPICIHCGSSATDGAGEL